MKEAANGVSLKAVPADDRLSFLAKLAQQIEGLEEGEQLRFDITE